MSESAPHVRLFVSVDGEMPREVKQPEADGAWVERSVDLVSQDRWLEGRVYVNRPSECQMVAWPVPRTQAIRDQENRIRVAIDDLVEFLNVMGAD